MRLDYEDVQTLLELANRKGINDQISCFDEISSIYNEDDQWTVKIFVEPVGDIEVKGNVLKEVLEFWLELFRSQPEDWDYATAGWYLEKYLHQRPFEWKSPTDARKVWELWKDIP